MPAGSDTTRRRRCGPPWALPWSRNNARARRAPRCLLDQAWWPGARGPPYTCQVQAPGTPTQRPSRRRIAHRHSRLAMLQRTRTPTSLSTVTRTSTPSRHAIPRTLPASSQSQAVKCVGLSAPARGSLARPSGARGMRSPKWRRRPARARGPARRTCGWIQSRELSIQTWNSQSTWAPVSLARSAADSTRDERWQSSSSTGMTRWHQSLS
mmetsp:Transcript_107375/g.299110  ORF Transcript_107375/g.299110 Transcript_107375/m.299110 type:complete len:210 (+) Transcript_107375:124-753(+)